MPFIQVPIPVKPNYQLFTAMNWIIKSADEKERGIRIWDTLATELIAASKNEVSENETKRLQVRSVHSINTVYAWAEELLKS